MIIGVSLMVFGVWLASHSGTRIDGAGFFFTGIGNILFGITNGFTDMTSTGRLLYRLALVAYLIGIPVIAYFLYKEIS